MNQVEALLSVVEEAKGQGNVVVVTGKPGSGKSKVLREAAEMKKWEYVDCRALITEEFLAVPAADRGLHAPDMFVEYLENSKSDVIILDRLQTLFVPVFHINTDSLMRKLSKKFTIITAWPGYVDGDSGYLCYDKFDGTEAIRISPDGFKVWNVE
ncbi:MAG: BREX-3 system P-loop-containing protein BrxF [Acidaminococcaceae bacterium]|nr:BREX-3 system P-loop-containing protein BrxF [Acidaminococcaceae bacterium]